MKTDVMNMFPEINVSADIMTGVTMTHRLKELTDKFKKGISENWEWYVDYLKQYENLKPLPYHVNFGLTKDEYEELGRSLDDVEVISVGKTVLSISKEDDLIRFQSTDGKLVLIDFVTIDLRQNVILIGGLDRVLKYDGKIDVSDEKNALKSKWSGHNWSFEWPKDQSSINFSDLENLSVKNYRFTVGRLEKSGKTMLRFSGNETEEGVKKISFDLTLIF